MRGVDVRHDGFGGHAADAVDGLHPSDLVVGLSDLGQLLVDCFKISLQRFQTSQLQVQFASPKFIQSTFGQRLGVLLKKNSARMLGLCTGTNADPLIDEDRSDDALALADQLDKFLAVLDQAAMFANGFGRNVSSNQLIYRS